MRNIDAGGSSSTIAGSSQGSGTPPSFSTSFFSGTAGTAASLGRTPAP